MNIADANAEPPPKDVPAQPELKIVEKKPAQAVVVKVDESGFFNFTNHIELNQAASMATQLALVPKKLLEAGGLQAAAAALVFCKQFKLPMKAMNEMGWIEGNLTCYGSLYWALCERHADYGEHEMFYLNEKQDKICSDNKNINDLAYAAVIKVKKKGQSVWNEYFFTMDDAKLAKLYPPTKRDGKENLYSPWWKYTKDMLMHKVKKRVGDTNYSSALNGVIYHEDAYEHLSRNVTPTDENKDEVQQLKDVFSDNSFIKEKSGECLAIGWNEYKDTKIKDINQDELIVKLSDIEQKARSTKPSDEVLALYGNACLFLGREKTI